MEREPDQARNTFNCDQAVKLKKELETGRQREQAREALCPVTACRSPAHQRRAPIPLQTYALYRPSSRPARPLSLHTQGWQIQARLLQCSPDTRIPWRPGAWGLPSLGLTRTGQALPFEKTWFPNAFYLLLAVASVLQTNFT